VRAVAARPERGKIAVEATLRAAAPLQLRRRLTRSEARPIPQILVEPDDLRWKQCSQRTGLVIIFVVDASGSMAHNRISQAKGAILRLLREAYRRRDKVALISFRADRAETLLPPGRSVELAGRALSNLAVGGATPLSAGLCAALETARHARRAGLGGPLVVLLSDGRANVARAAPCAATGAAGRTEVWNELEKVCKSLRAEGIPCVVIDTSHRHHRSDEGERLAELLGGRYVLLPFPSVERICETVSDFAERLRKRLEAR
jgi:magnesium chelatase subunit D